jgi:hypothetical protein
MQRRGTSVDTDRIRQWLNAQFASLWEANNGPAQSAYFMHVLLENLPAVVRQAVERGRLGILDWGCAFGDGAAALKKAFPASSVTGLDLSDEAVRRASTRFPALNFIQSDDIPGIHDVITISNCLEHLEQPLAVMRAHLACCRHLYIALVPYDEHPLMDGHRSQFREESFPAQVGGWTRLEARHFPTNPKFWAGRQLLVVYASPEFMRRYGGQPADGVHDLLVADARMERECAALLAGLLPDGGEVLVTQVALSGVACAAAGHPGIRAIVISPHSALLAQAAESARAAHSAATFLHAAEGAGIAADVVLHAPSPGISPDAWTAQLADARGRARRWVTLLLPNPLNVWTWVRRMEDGGQAHAPDIPFATDMTQALSAAGLHVIGQAYVGSSAQDAWLESTPGLSDGLRRTLGRLYQPASPLLPDARGAYTMLLCSAQSEPAPPGWEAARERAGHLHAALADALRQSEHDRMALAGERERVIPDWIALMMERDMLRAELEQLRRRR